MDYSYIAGFFDGEGCITMAMGSSRHCTNPQVKITQADDIGRKVLQEIQTFIHEKDGIKSSLRLAAPPKDGDSYRALRKKPIWIFNIHSRESVSRFVKRVFPYLIVKKTKSQDVVRFLTLFPAMPQKQRNMLARERGWKAKLTNDQTNEIAKRKLNGERTNALAREFGINRHTVSKIAHSFDEHGTVFIV